MPAIKTIEVGGKRRYRFVVDVGRSPEGKRLQRTHTFDRRKDAEAELARITHTVRTGEFVDRSKITVAELIDRYLRHAAFEAEENTKLSYRLALEPARERLGERHAQAVEREDIEALRDWMLTSGRRRGGKPGTPLGARSVQLTLGKLSAAFELGVRDRKVTRNPVRYVELPKQVKRDPDTWSAAQVQAFLSAAAGHRLHAAWRLTLYGLRRGEVCGLRWSDVDLAAGTIAIANTRIVVDGTLITKGPKSQRGTRTLPLDAELRAALEALHDRQVTEAMEAGEAYAASGYVVTDELGAPVHPDWYSDEFHRLRESAGIARITLRNSRATANTLMADAGVPDHVRAAWCGHTVAVNVRSYTAVRPEALGAALGALSAMQNPV
ncbi:MAG: tyrosine-type recombinase/integrase [Trebonia sp.]